MLYEAVAIISTNAPARCLAVDLVVWWNSYLQHAYFTSCLGMEEFKFCLYQNDHHTNHYCIVKYCMVAILMLPTTRHGDTANRCAMPCYPQVFDHRQATSGLIVIACGVTVALIANCPCM